MQTIDKLFELSAVAAAYYTVIIITRKKRKLVKNQTNKVVKNEKAEELEEKFDAKNWGLIVGFILIVSCIIYS